jgi:hypothetical protein
MILDNPFVNALRQLTILGRIQVGIVTLSAVTTATLLWIDDTSTSTLGCTLATEYAAATLVFVAVTIMKENEFTFAALVLMLINQVALLTVGALITTNPKHDLVRWAVVALSASALTLYALLQVCARGTWGWHAYKQMLHGDDKRLYRRVQRLQAALLLDVCHAAFSATTLFFIHLDWRHRAFVIANGGCALLLGPCLVFGAVRQESIVAVTLLVLLEGLGGGALAVAAWHALHYEQNRHGEHSLGLIELWCAVASRLVVLLAGVTVVSVFGHGIHERLERAKREGGTLIGEDDVRRAILAPHVTKSSAAKGKSRKGAARGFDGAVITGSVTTATPQSSTRDVGQLRKSEEDMTSHRGLHYGGIDAESGDTP